MKAKMLLTVLVTFLLIFPRETIAQRFVSSQAALPVHLEKKILKFKKGSLSLRGSGVLFLVPAQARVNLLSYFGLKLNFQPAKWAGFSLALFAGHVANVLMSEKQAANFSVWINWALSDWFYGFHELDVWLSDKVDYFTCHIIGLKLPLGVRVGAEIETVNTIFSIGPFAGFLFFEKRVMFAIAYYFNFDRDSLTHNPRLYLRFFL